MIYEFAPMEGFTGYTFRRLHHKYFPGMDAYFTPFISPTKDNNFTPRQIRDLAPENNPPVRIVPQVMTRIPEHFVWAALELTKYGCSEVNLNLGCPSGTVCSKGKGAGMLEDVEALDRFFYEVFRELEPYGIRIGIKTRLGLEDPEHFKKLIPVYLRYPFSEIIVHPRIRRDFYSAPVRMEYFTEIYDQHCSQNSVPEADASKIPGTSVKSASAGILVYNGGLSTVESIRRLEDRFPNLKAVMLGQGMLKNPALVREAQGGPKLNKEELTAFMEELFEGSCEELGSAHNALFRMKDHWKQAALSFEENKKGLKRIMKAKNESDYRAAVDAYLSDTMLLS